MSNKSDKEIAAEILIAAINSSISSSQSSANAFYSPVNVSGAKQIEAIAAAFKTIHEAVKDCDKS